MLRVTDVDYLKDYSLSLTFSNHEKRVVNLEPHLTGEVFGELLDKSKFTQFGLTGMGQWCRLRARIPLRDRDSGVMSEIDAKQLSMDYGRRVRELRKEKNLTQRQLSEITGLKREYISLIEHGRTDMQLSTFLKIADALDVQISM